MKQLPEGWWVLPGIMIVVIFIAVLTWVHNTASVEELPVQDPGVEYECYDYDIRKQEFVEVPCK